MLKKNMRKRLLAGALATIMALTMCPTWALAVDEDINTLPAPEGQMPAVDSTPAEDTIQTPDAGTQGQTEPKDTEQAGQLENQDPAQAPSGGTDIEETGNNSSSNENDSQNNDAVSNSPANEIAPTSGNSDNAVDVYANKVQTIEAEYWITNRRADGDDGNSMTINEALVGNGKAVTALAPAEREATADADYNTVFWQARVHASNKKQTEQGGDDKTAKGTEITNIRYNDGQLEYQAKDSSEWTAFAEGSQLVFYYLIRTEYSQMVQIDVSDWTVNAEPDWKRYPARRSVTYQVIVKDGPDANTVLSSKKFWYNSAVNVSAVRVRQTETADYTIDSVVLDPKGLGTVKNVNGEYQFGLKLSETWRNATVNIYVSATSHNLTYDANGGKLADGSYSKGKVYPKIELTLPTNAEITREGYTFDGWYDENNKLYQNGDLMPNKDLKLTAHWTKNTPEPEPEKYKAMYFILLPTLSTPTSSADQGEKQYLPSSISDGGVKDLNDKTGYPGHITKAAKNLVPDVGNIIDIFDDEGNVRAGFEDGYGATYLEVPKNLGFFNPENWTNDGYNLSKTDTDADLVKKLLGDKFNLNSAKNVKIVWYTIKNQNDGIHVDGFLKDVDIEVIYHSNFDANTDETFSAATKTGKTYTAVDYAQTKLKEKPGYEFVGWYMEPAGTTAYTTRTLMSSLHLYARWNPKSYNVIYQYEDGKTTYAEEPHNVDSSVTVKTVDDAYPAKDGFTFTGWTLETEGVEITDGEFTMPAHDVIFTPNYVKNPDPEYKYTINQHFYDANGDEIANMASSKNGTAVKGTSIETLYADYAKNQQNYVYVPSMTTITPASQDGRLVEAVTINLHYYLDAKGDREKPEEKGDGIPDAWEYRLTFKVVNGNWNNDTNAGVIVYVPFKDANGNAIANVVIPDGIPTAGEKPAAGYREGKWDTTPVVGATVANDTVFTYTYEKIPDPTKHHYTINKHFYNEKGAEVNVAKGEPTSAVENTEIKDLYTANKQETFKNQTYVYVPGLTKVTDNLEKLTKDVTIDLYYYLDVKGGEKPDETGNGIPDAWEYRLAFKVVNGEWNNGGSADIVVYVPFKDNKTGDELKYAVVPITRIPVVGDKPNSGYRAGSWDTTPVGNAKVEKDTVFTYTYAKKSSSGGGGGGGSRKPTVTIPDDVPTGLNGDDHYAYIVGYPDSTVRPQNGITRAEVATIFFRLLTDETRNANSTKSNSYSDVAAGAWYNHAVSTLSAMGIVKGDSQGKFNPNAPITRAEFAAIAARFDDKANTTAVDFSDIASHWAKNEISAAANNGWINGYTDGTFRPNNKITRAEAMTLVNRVLKRLPETAEDLHNDMIKWSDNSDTSAWYYLAVQEATNSHYYDLKENKHEKWSKLRETRDWTELEK